MGDLNFLAMAVAAVAVFVVSTAWYTAFGKQYAELRELDESAAAEQPAPWMILVELGRSLVVAAVIAGLVDQIGIDDVGGAAALGGSLWIAFPAVLLSGAVMWDKVPWKLAVIHGGDWFVKLGVITAIVTAWQ